VAESFFSRLKLELDFEDNRKGLIAPQELQCDLAFWIEGYYNHERRHSTMGDLSPIIYENSSSRPLNSPLRSLEPCPRNRGNPTPLGLALGSRDSIRLISSFQGPSASISTKNRSCYWLRHDRPSVEVRVRFLVVVCS